MIRLLVLTQKAEGIAPNQRFRIEQWAPHLARDHGISVHFEPFETPELTRVIYEPGRTLDKARHLLASARRRWRVLRRADAYDAVLVLREAMMIGGPWLERALARRGLPLIYDFDDVIWRANPEGRNGMLALVRMPWKTGAICALASAVTVGNEHLASYARRFSRHVHLVYTSVDVDQYPALPEPASDVPFTVVWAGSPTTRPNLETIRPALDALALRRPVRLRVICDAAPPPFERVELEFVRWSAVGEAERLADSHVGVMPLPDNPLTRGKCGLKALQYMALGRATVVSPVGFNAEIVQDGENGLWATTTEEWVAALDRLAGDPALRGRLGAAGRVTVHARFSARRSAARLAEIVRSVVPSAAAPAARDPQQPSDSRCAVSPAS
jgi:glycosyltransferase involved in cell wall biosynthesis